MECVVAPCKSADGTSFNPCYNGMTMESQKKDEDYKLLRFNPCYNGMTMEFEKNGQTVEVSYKF